MLLKYIYLSLFRLVKVNLSSRIDEENVNSMILDVAKAFEVYNTKGIQKVSLDFTK